MTMLGILDNHDLCNDPECDICTEILRPVQLDSVRRGRWVCLPFQTFYDESPIPITKSESALLYLFARSKKILRAADVISQISFKGSEINDPTNLFNAHHSRLKKTLSKCGLPHPLRNVFRVGYLFDDQDPGSHLLLLSRDHVVDYTHEPVVVRGNWSVSQTEVKYKDQRLSISLPQCRLLYEVITSHSPLHAKRIGQRCAIYETRDPATLFGVQYFKLKKKLIEQNIPNPLESIWGVGYQWVNV